MVRRINFTSPEANKSNYKRSTEKAVVIIFDRGDKTQFTNAKPILDKYGFRASFFIICSFINDNVYYKLQDGIEGSYTNLMFQ